MRIHTFDANALGSRDAWGRNI